MNPSQTQIDDVEKILRAGLTEAAGAYSDEFEPFIRIYAPHIGTLAARASAGDDAAKVSLEQLRAQVVTHEYIARLRAAGVGDQALKLIVGTTIRLALGAI
jgi:hypothetical protein